MVPEIKKISSQKEKDIRQSSRFALFMSRISWQTEKFNGNYVYLKRFPLVGFFAKMPRPRGNFSGEHIKSFIKDNRIFRFKISPYIRVSGKKYEIVRKDLFKSGFKIDKEPFNPTTTLTVDLTGREEEIFRSFREAKRRGVRRAIKNGVTAQVSDKIEEFIRIRQAQFKPMGFLITREMICLWESFYPGSCDLLLAKSSNNEYLAGILLLYHKSLAYYWYAASTMTGKKLFAPTLLVFEAVKQAKKRGAKILDFEGIYDERFPKASQNWRGFTKFKEGFSDNKKVFAENFYFNALKPAILGNIW